MRDATVVPVLWCGDARVLPGLAISLASALRSAGRRTRLRVAVIGQGFSAAARDALEAWLEAEPGVAAWEVHEFPALLAQAGYPDSLHPAFARCFVHDIFPDDVGKVVYLDTDTLVRVDLAALHEQELAPGHVLGAVNDCAIGSWASRCLVEDQRRLGITATGPHFNSGVLLIDIPEWRRARIGEQVVENFLATGPLTFRDQSRLNAFTYGRWTELPERFNWQRYIEEGAPLLVLPRREQAIIHLTRAIKPWEFAREGSYGVVREFLETLATVPSVFQEGVAPTRTTGLSDQAARELERNLERTLRRRALREMAARRFPRLLALVRRLRGLSASG